MVKKMKNDTNTTGAAMISVSLLLPNLLLTQRPSMWAVLRDVAPAVLLPAKSVWCIRL